MGGFRYIVGGLILIVAAFAAVSSWPLLLAAFNPAPGAQTPQPVAAQAASPQPPPATMTPAPLLTPNPTEIPAPEPSITLTELPDETPPHPGWLYLQESAVLRKTPGGQGMPAPSLTKAQLVIVKGTRLWPRKIEGGWVLVKSPGGHLGWLAVEDVSRHIPFTRH